MPEADSAFHNNLKMELLVKIVIDFKLQALFAKSFILDVSQVLRLPLTAINQMFFTKNKRAIS